MMFADVILPLPVAGAYTYSLPASLLARVQAGCRVIVPFGTKKYYSAIVLSVHGNTPNYPTKEVLDVLDEYPILLPSQMKLWQWIADYYLCSIGEVYKAALPGGLKLESETMVVFNEEFDGDESLTSSEQKIMDVLSVKKELSLLALQKETGLRAIPAAIKGLLEKGTLLIKEEMKRVQQPKTRLYVRLGSAYFEKDRLEEVQTELRRSPKQAALLAAYLERAKASAALSLQNPGLLEEIAKADLLTDTGISSAVFNALRERGILEIYEKTVSRLSQGEMPKEVVMNPLSVPQQQALNEINQVFARKNVCLLHGVTSSGKTEVYIHLIQQMLDKGCQVLYLLPEIVLTTQLTERLKRVFGNRLGVYHSKYPDAERVELYQKMLSDSPYDIIVGVRSSVFLPFQKLGLVIVDEEHESSFKQQDPAPRYHARNVALILASQMGAKTLLGTATPSLESYYNAQNGKYGLVTLKTRFRGAQLPEIEVVNMHELYRKKILKGFFSPQLLHGIKDALSVGQQVILFQNRRGYAPVIECHVCGWVPRCQRCDVSLTYHKDSHQMTCHYCGAVYPIPQSCPCCESDRLFGKGYGTERIEDEIKELFPEAQVARMDLDTTRSRQNYERILDDFQHGRTDILIGTQMVTKGLDFDRVSVVGILNAGTMLNQPDFRSYERAFQMMSQVAGRSGRRGRQGKVIMQTRDVQASVIGQVVRHDYEAMFSEQIQERELFQYPPFCRLVYVYLKHRDERIADQMASEMANLMCQVFAHRVLGPDKPYVSRVQLMHIRKIVLKVELPVSMSDVRQRLRQIQQHLLSLPAYKSGQVYYDVDPV